MIYELQDEYTEMLTGDSFRYFDDAYIKAQDLASCLHHPIQVWDSGRYLLTVQPKSGGVDHG